MSPDNGSNQSISQRPHYEISLACLPQHPAVAYLFLVSLGPGLSDAAYSSWQRRGWQK